MFFDCLLLFFIYIICPLFISSTGYFARFNNLNAIAVDTTGNLVVADQGNNRIRLVSTCGVVSTLAGDGTPGTVDGYGTTAKFRAPADVAFDSIGNLWVSEQV